MTRFLGSGETAQSRLKARSAMGEDVYEVLLSQIISLKIAPRERISVDALARELGVSQTPIRAALIRLEAEGLVVKKHNVGYSAAPVPNARHFEEIYEMRMLLEPAAAELAARNMTQETAERLQEAHDHMCELENDIAQRNYSQFARFDAEFHAIIAEASGNSLIVDTLDRLRIHTHLFRSRQHFTITHEAVSEHIVLLDALLNGKTEDAKWAMADHIARSRERIVPFSEMDHQL
ncbi:GntR family transcriptional regulator [Halomonas sp. MCCC 1A11036]|uniref:GntR family transcriptional regulator n=1 Tax=Billgrantia zhangzhouensis TaxID=2733481 RepID=A0ABS9A9G6_9GAMM|nr:GntR family transcriptional regulator [Halomonas zhangzhouensis]MCE8018571.1 GntR family transcriptional regulator [Halomonas zhangzhouensis]